MKTKIVVSCFVLMVVSSMSMKAQDTIDTAYYRYGNNFLYSDDPFCVWDPSTGSYVLDPETGGTVSACPNGYGFLEMRHVQFHQWDIYPQYILYKIGGLALTEPKTPIYGIAISLDSVSNFTEGDSVTVIICEPSSDRTHFVHLDSITLRGGDIGKRRWCEIPIQKPCSNEVGAWFSVQDNCIDTVLYRSVMEFYFDVPVSISGSSVYWKVRRVNDYGSVFHSTRLWCLFDMQLFFNEDCTGTIGYTRWDDIFPILTPLPEWEVPGLEQLIPDREYNPAVHQQDPEDPEDPENPEDPSGTEAINDFYGKLPISVYPNPTTGLTNISSPEAIKELVVTDLAGRVLLRQTPHQSSATLDTSPLSSGLYLLKVNTDSGSSTTKLTVR